eukprot:gene11853-24843_t
MFSVPEWEAIPAGNNQTQSTVITFKVVSRWRFYRSSLCMREEDFTAMDEEIRNMLVQLEDNPDHDCGKAWLKRMPQLH